jgi:hypothetical protein
MWGNEKIYLRVRAHIFPQAEFQVLPGLVESSDIPQRSKSII